MKRMPSVVEDNGSLSTSCGYCGGRDTSRMVGMWGHSLTPSDYGDLLDRGWRRGGRWLYQPDMDRTCCPQYTIRLSANRFKPSKQQRKVVQKFKSWIVGTELSSTISSGAVGSTSHTENMVAQSGPDRSAETCHSVAGQVPEVVNLQIQETDEDKIQALGLTNACGRTLQDAGNDLLQSTSFRVVPLPAKLRRSLPSSVRFTSSTAFPAAAVARKQGNASATAEATAAAVAEELDRACQDPKQGIALRNLGLTRVEAHSGYINFHTAKDRSTDVRTSRDGRAPRETATGARAPRQNGSRETCNKPLPLRFLDSYGGFSGTADFTVMMKPADYSEEEFDLYRQYQISQHGDKPEAITRQSFSHFLVDSPMQHEPPAEGSAAPPCGYGSFHVQYRVRGRLIAVSVVDVLPRCLSSKYFFWDPGLRRLSLGKLSVLFEVFWVQEMMKVAPALQHYYLGYYIHSCPKMSYKAEYRPSDLLCPARYIWTPFERAVELLDRHTGGLCALSDALQEPSGQEAAVGERSQNSRGPFSVREVLSTMLVLHDGSLKRLGQVVADGDSPLLHKIRRWCDAVGEPARRMVYLLPNSHS